VSLVCLLISLKLILRLIFHRWTLFFRFSQGIVISPIPLIKDPSYFTSSLPSKLFKVTRKSLLSDLDAERSQCQGTMGMTTGLYYLDAERLDTYEYVGIAKGIGNTYSQCQGTMGMTTERRNDRMRYK
jgi:hypothetical protein